MVLATSLIPMDQDANSGHWTTWVSPSVQNILHVPMFGVLAALWLQVTAHNSFPAWKKTCTVFLAVLCFGILNEMVQFFVPGRYPGLTDVALNTLGTLAGTLFCLRHHNSPVQRPT